MANPNTPEGRIEQASGFASRITSGARVSRDRRSVLWFLGGMLAVVVIGISIAAVFLPWLTHWMNS